MDKLKFETKSESERNIERLQELAELFPEVITESRDSQGNLVKTVKWDTLRSLLGDRIAEGAEAYDFTWVGKREALIEAGLPIRKTLRPVRADSVNWDTTQNLYIEGDNLDVLKLLTDSYLGKIKMIYIDPPYNTGTDFVYQDNRTMSQEEYDEGIEKLDEDGNINYKENLTTNPRFHSEWCSMIYPRLKIARNLLSDDGVIFISIDDNEQANMKKICDELFGANNFVAKFIWEKTQHFGRQKLNVYSNADYVFCYAKKLIDIRNGQPRLIRYLVDKINEDLEDAPLYNASNNEQILSFPANTVKFNMRDGVYSASTDPKYKLLDAVTVKNGRNTTEFRLQFRSRWANNTVQQAIKEGTIYWVKTDSFAIRAIYGDGKTAFESAKQILFTNQRNEFLAQSRFGQRVETSEIATDTVNKLLGKQMFSYPKPVSLIAYLIAILFDEKKNDFSNDFIVLDFFSGSGTTAQAVMELNAADGGNRKFICVQLSEDLDFNITKVRSTNEKTIIQNAIDFCDENGKPHSLSEIGKERIRRAGAKIAEENRLTAPNLDVGFRVFKLDESNMKDVYYSAGELANRSFFDDLTDNIKDDRTAEDLLYSSILEWGLSLTLPHTEETIEGKKVFVVNGGDLIACFEKDLPESVIKAIANRKPLNALFRESCFKDSPAKINNEEIFKLISPSTKVKVL